MNSVIVGQSVAGAAAGIAVGFIGAKAIRVGFNLCYDADAKKNEELISRVSKITCVVLGSIAAIAAFNATRTGFIALSLMIEGRTALIEKVAPLLKEMEELRNQLAIHGNNAHKYMFAYNNVGKLGGDLNKSEQISKVFRKTMEQYKATFDLWKLASQRLEAIFSASAGKAGGGFDALSEQVKTIDAITSMHESILKNCFNFIETTLDKSPKSGG